MMAPGAMTPSMVGAAAVTGAPPGAQAVVIKSFSTYIAAAKFAADGNVKRIPPPPPPAGAGWRAPRAPPKPKSVADPPAPTEDLPSEAAAEDDKADEAGEADK